MPVADVRFRTQAQCLRLNRLVASENHFTQFIAPSRILTRHQAPYPNPPEHSAEKLELACPHSLIQKIRRVRIRYQRQQPLSRCQLLEKWRLRRRTSFS